MTTPPAALPPANWYPDPQTPGQLRYWDGQKWTQHVHPAGQPAQAVGGAGAAPAGPSAPGGTAPGTAAPGATAPGTTGQQGAGMFMPSGRPGGPANPQQASPGQFLGGPGPSASDPASTGSFRPVGGAAGGPGMTAPTLADIDSDDGGRGQDPKDPVHWLVPTGRSLQAVLAGVFAFLALLLTAAAIWGLGTDFDAYITYAGAGLGFLAVLFGFIGLSKANRGEHGKGRSYFGIGAGFLALGLCAYEILYPGELLGIFGPYLGIE